MSLDNLTEDDNERDAGKETPQVNPQPQAQVPLPANPQGNQGGYPGGYQGGPPVLGPYANPQGASFNANGPVPGQPNMQYGYPTQSPGYPNGANGPFGQPGPKEQKPWVKWAVIGGVAFLVIVILVLGAIAIGNKSDSGSFQQGSSQSAPEQKGKSDKDALKGSDSTKGDSRNPQPLVKDGKATTSEINKALKGNSVKDSLEKACKTHEYSCELSAEDNKLVMTLGGREDIVDTAMNNDAGTWEFNNVGRIYANLIHKKLTMEIRGNGEVKTLEIDPHYITDEDAREHIKAFNDDDYDTGGTSGYGGMDDE